ncbi:uncharacterized protein LOC130962039 [Arachis stenosperma]|uniref:uncharacterized protein LOC130962039 n=1 Tax=Arachis stenosperma TaxID=217475 RepID=UPI0025AD9093|nr:uncharacterized protein LOC130962039 [Arachis stenosperma]
MAMRKIYASLPAVAAGVGFFFYNAKDHARRISASNQETISTTRVVEEQTKAIRKPSVAPQFDGLRCFETFVMNKKLARGISASNQETISTTRVVEEQTKASRKPSVAPQFDGLHCFETFVMN